MDEEYEEEVNDYAVLLQRSRRGQKQAPRRGGKTFLPTDSQEEQDAIATSRKAWMQLISDDAPSSSKSTSHGQFDYTTGLTTLTQKKGPHLRVMGQTMAGKDILYPEEAAWLLNMNALITVDDKGQRCGMAEYYAFMFSQSDGWITFEKYQVYAYLRRLGYIVQRAKATATTPEIKASCWLDTLLPRLKSFVRVILEALHLGLWMWRTAQPLVCDYRYTTTDAVYAALQIVSSAPWSVSSTDDYPVFDWNVYKPTPQWKKSKPGEPNYCIKVTSARQAIPTLSTYQHLFGRTHSSPSDYPAIRYTKMPMSAPSFLFGVVDQAGTVSFLRLTGDGVADIAHRTPSINKPQRPAAQTAQSQ